MNDNISDNSIINNHASEDKADASSYLIQSANDPARLPSSLDLPTDHIDHQTMDPTNTQIQQADILTTDTFDALKFNQPDLDQQANIMQNTNQGKQQSVIGNFDQPNNAHTSNTYQSGVDTILKSGYDDTAFEQDSPIATKQPLNKSNIIKPFVDSDVPLDLYPENQDDKNQYVQADNHRKDVPLHVNPFEQSANADEFKSIKEKNLEESLHKLKGVLKQKNMQIENLQRVLAKVDKFGQTLDAFKSDVSTLRSSHEQWTVSVAEMKKCMHQELEVKGNKLNQSIKKLDEAHKYILELKNQQESSRLRIGEIESKLISQSVAHEKERENLTKELKVSKVNAIKQMQKDHEVNFERMKLGLEQTIESLKRDLLMKDSEIIKYSTEFENYKSYCQELETKLENKNTLPTADKSTNYDEVEVNQSELDIVREKLTRSREKFENLEKENHLMRTEILQLTQKIKKLAQENETQSSENLKQIADLKTENESLIARQRKKIEEKAMDTNTQNTLSATEYEYLKNIVFQFMLGRQPTVLAKVISTVFKYEQDQVERVCKVQEAMESLLDGVKTIK